MRVLLPPQWTAPRTVRGRWIKGKNEKGEDFHFHTDRYDEFRFYKDGYTLDVFFDIPLDQDPDKLIWGDKRELYVITMARIEFY